MRSFFALFLCAVLCLSVCLPAFAVGEMTSVEASASEIPIWTVEDMLKISEKPDAAYRLMRDLDMSGVEWNSPAFSGTFHGNGHAILNLTISSAGTDTFSALNANEKTVECAGAGLFGVMQGAQVDYLTLLGVRCDLTASAPTFVGAIAGASFESTIENCAASGSLKLTADEFYGIGGMVGYGSVSMTRCRAEETLICHDSNTQTNDYAYLGGLLAYGFPIVRSCEVELDGYMGISGTSYSGGIVGVMLQYSLMREGKAEIYNTTANGQLTVMENSQHARVEANQTVGKINKTWNYAIDGISGKVETHVSQNQEKLPAPEQCVNPNYVEELYDPDCDYFGYSEYVCSGCGYSYRCDYTLKDHRVTDWKPHATVADMMEGVCAICEAKAYEWRTNIPALQEEEVIEVPTTYPAVEPAEQVQVLEQTKHDGTYVLAWVFLVLAVGIAAGLVLYVVKARRK